MYVQVKLWEVPADGISGSLSSATATFGPMEVSCGGEEEREGRGEERREKSRKGEGIGILVLTYVHVMVILDESIFTVMSWYCPAAETD